MAVELESLGRSVKQLQYRHHRAMEVRLAQVGTTLAQWDALRAIENNPGASAHTLAVATFQTDQSFGTLANRLHAQGLIERTPGQGRRIDHHLTRAGQNVLRAGYPLTAAVMDESFAELSETERTTLFELISRVLRDGDA